ncbi:MAG: hypothetical protein Ct9H300mP2_2320 [Candidatus Neomarinimicrobiota bacterium]|nr:MAG: hypothetical protein Ct9H300mP2_2320 [Candidatus Neomarinimicrobiota bacterium]
MLFYHPCWHLNPIYFYLYGEKNFPFPSNRFWVLVVVNRTPFGSFYCFIYSAIASLLPVWFLFQPRDYINSHQLFVGLSLLFIGLFVAHPVIDAPAFRSGGEDAPFNFFPLLFVTIACGAIKRFFPGLVSSGTKIQADQTNA